MALAPRTRIRLLSLAVAVPAAAAVGTVYSWFDTGDLVISLATGGVIGAVICSVLMSLQLFGASAAMRRRLRRAPFGVPYAVSLLVTLAVVLAGIAIGQATGAAVRGAVPTIEFTVQDVLFSMVVSAIFVGVTTLDRVLGGSVLVGLLTGRYVTPQQEQRVFLFADLVGSTALAERLGDVAFHRVLDEVFCLLAEPVVRHGGSIYRYVGDEMIVTWPLRDGRNAQRALACVLDCRRTLAQRAEAIRTAHGCTPELRYALHAGPVVTGQMGDLKREVVFLGDTVNTTARLEELAKQRGCEIVVSDVLLAGLELPDGLRAEPLEDVALRGKTRPVRAFAVRAVAAQSSAGEPARAAHA